MTAEGHHTRNNLWLYHHDIPIAIYLQIKKTYLNITNTKELIDSRRANKSNIRSNSSVRSNFITNIGATIDVWPNVGSMLPAQHFVNPTIAFQGNSIKTEGNRPKSYKRGNCNTPTKYDTLITPNTTLQLLGNTYLSSN